MSRQRAARLAGGPFGGPPFACKPTQSQYTPLMCTVIGDTEWLDADEVVVNTEGQARYPIGPLTYGCLGLS